MALKVKNMCLFLGGHGFRREGDIVCMPLYSVKLVEKKEEEGIRVCKPLKFCVD